MEQFARPHITTDGGRLVEMDMGVDYREGEPVTLSVSPVLSLDDAVANKVSALYSRAEARDYPDVRQHSDCINTYCQLGRIRGGRLSAASQQNRYFSPLPQEHGR